MSDLPDIGKPVSQLIHDEELRAAASLGPAPGTFSFLHQQPTTSSLLIGGTALV